MDDKEPKLVGGADPRTVCPNKGGYHGVMLEVMGKPTVTKSPVDTTNHYDTASTAMLYGRKAPE
jgi:hypothetical protein